MEHPERIIQINIVNWLRQKHPEIMFHANISEQRSTPAWRNLQTQMGFRKGVADLFFPASSHIPIGRSTNDVDNIKKEAYKGLWLELKSENGKTTTEQLKFISDMTKLGYCGYIAYGYDEAERVIRWFYNLQD